MKPYRDIFFLIGLIHLTVGMMFSQYTNKRVTQDSLDQSETAIAVSPQDDNRMLAAWNDHHFGKEGYAFSTDGGKNWTQDTLPTPQGTNYSKGTDPAVAFDQSGTAFFCYLARLPGIPDSNRVYVGKTTNQSNTFSADSIHRVSNSTLKQDKPMMAVDNTGGTHNGRIYVCWQQQDSVGENLWDVMFAYSADHGSSYHLSPIPDTSGGQLDSLDPNQNYRIRTRGKYPMPAVAHDGKVYVVWLDAGDFKVSSSTDGGVAFGNAKIGPHIPAPQDQYSFLSERISNIPSLAVAPNGNLCLAYTEWISNSDQRYRVKYSQSQDGGTSWSSPFIVWEPGAGENQQYFPVVAVDGSGRIDLAFVYGTVGSDTVANTYFAVSSDGGASFSVRQKLSDVNSNPARSSSCHPPATNCGVNDYIGMALTGTGKMCVLWTDRRNNDGDAYFASTKPDPAIPSSPSDCAMVSVTPTLSWDAFTGPSPTYRLLVATSPGFESPVVDVSGLTSASYQPSNLSPGTPYYWSVNVSSLGFTSDWYWHPSFHTTPPPAALLTGTTTEVYQLGQLITVPSLSWTTSGWCNVTYGLYRYGCWNVHHGCDTTDCEGTGELIYNGSETSYVDPTMWVGDWNCVNFRYYVDATATANGSTSRSNKVWYGSVDPSKTAQRQDKAVEVRRPSETALDENYPDPFNPTTTIKYELANDYRVALRVYNLLGQIVATLKEGVEAAGYKQVEWNASNVTSGVYFYRLEAVSLSDPGKGFTSVKKMLVAR